MKIVLDTNVLVSGLLRAHGNPAQKVGLVLAGSVQICHSPEILTEYREVLARPKFKFDPQRVREVLEKIKLDGTSVDASHRELNLPDPDDVPFLAVTLAASADFLVTGNLAHFPENKREGCAVTSPAQFMERWRKLPGADSPK